MTYNVGNSSGDIYRSNVNSALNDLDSKKLSANGNGSQITNVNAVSVNGIKIWKGTQAQYNAIGTKDPNTIYYVS